MSSAGELKIRAAWTCDSSLDHRFGGVDSFVDGEEGREGSEGSDSEGSDHLLLSNSLSLDRRRRLASRDLGLNGRRRGIHKNKNRIDSRDNGLIDNSDNATGLITLARFEVHHRDGRRDCESR